MPSAKAPRRQSIDSFTLFKRRMSVLTLGLVILTSFLIIRLGYLDILQFRKYRTLSKKNQLNIIPLAPTRGLIYDRNGKLLAKNIPVYSLELTPEKVPNIKETLQKLGQLIPSINSQDIDNFYRSKNQHRSFESVPLKFKLTDEEVAQFAVRKHRFPGVEIKARLMRYYPLGEATAHVLGFVGRINSRELTHLDSVNYRATNFIGKVGIEKHYEKLLHGKVGFQEVETNASGRTLRVLRKIPTISGANLYLTIDSDLQKAAMQALKDKQGSVVAIDPNNGEILALVSQPSYEPNLFVQGISQDAYSKLAKSHTQPLYNRALRGQYPLASTIKPFISLRALDENIVNLRYKIYDPGWYKLPNTQNIYRDWKRGGHGWINLQSAIVVSCDTYFYHLSMLMGIRRIDDILTQFGFGHTTGIDMGEELPGLIPTPQWKQITKHTAWYTGDTLISGIGQGFMLTTPLQLANATAMLANRGRSYGPHLLLKKDHNESVQTFKPVENYPLILKDKNTWEYVIAAMEAVIKDKAGTGFRFGRHPKYTVAAKTGTAQVYNLRQHQYESEDDLPTFLRDHSLFIGFAPVQQPKIAIAVIVENDNNASNIARKVMDNYLLRKKKQHAQ